MKLNQIINNPSESLKYMERLVNNGSPSKFSFLNTTSKETCPLFTSSYKICKVIDSTDKFITIGEIPCDEKTEMFDFIYLHPDWKTSNVNFKIYDTDISVCPTSSSRTVLPIDKNYYIKMSYPGVLGRITRELEREHINSSIDITSILLQLASKIDAPDSLAFFPEKGGKIYKSDIGNIGYVIRDLTPVGKNAKKIHSLIPAFALFSQDRTNDDIPIIIQLLSESQKPLMYLFEQLIFKVIDCYFYCIFHGGIQPEMHSQNFLIGIDENLNICSIVLRDLESVDKDITIMKKNKIHTHLLSYPFKCIEESQYNYKIKHSFMFDHKLCEYFFDELVLCLQKHKYVMEETIEKIIKEYINDKYGSLLKDFFPENNMWYKFEQKVIDRSLNTRPYVELKNPKYR